ncbi:MAG TPA: class I SAM-dependent methyltransferase [Candidatus Hydrogenedentes bacterium]|mgnify:FL=1|nr:class I SAM-dependent methyltransferase [Candidatus Hydrogenedentota bacterium]
MTVTEDNNADQSASQDGYATVFKEATAPCLFCGSESSKALFTFKDPGGRAYRLRRCLDCQARFIDPTPTRDELARAYDAAYYGKGAGKFSGPVEAILDRFRRGRAVRLAKLLPNRARVLDVGCGNGGFLRALHALGSFELHGVELPGPAADRTSRHPFIRLKTGTLEASDFPAASLDAVTLFHVLEHLDNPRAVLDMAVHFLRPGGFLMISFPNIDSLQARLFRANWFHLDPPRHLCFLPPAAFRKQAEARGLRILGERYFSPEQNPYGFQQSVLNLFQQRRDALFEGIKGNMVYDSAWGRLGLTVQKALVVLTGPFFIAMDAIESGLKTGATVEFVAQKGGDAEGTSNAEGATDPD